MNSASIAKLTFPNRQSGPFLRIHTMANLFYCTLFSSQGRLWRFASYKKTWNLLSCVTYFDVLSKESLSSYLNIKTWHTQTKHKDLSNFTTFWISSLRCTFNHLNRTNHSKTTIHLNNVSLGWRDVSKVRQRLFHSRMCIGKKRLPWVCWKKKKKWFKKKKVVSIELIEHFKSLFHLI